MCILKVFITSAGKCSAGHLDSGLSFSLPLYFTIPSLLAVLALLQSLFHPHFRRLSAHSRISLQSVDTSANLSLGQKRPCYLFRWRLLFSSAKVSVKKVTVDLRLC